MVSIAELYKAEVDADIKQCSCSTQRLGAKRVWEASLSSLKSKKVKGSHLVGCQLVSESGEDGSSYRTCLLAASENKSLAGLPCKDPPTNSYDENIVESCAQGNIPSEVSVRKEFHPSGECYKIMLMNIADDTKKAALIKVYPA